MTVEEGTASFDLMVKLSTLSKGNRITIPTRKTVVLNKWMDVPGAKIVQGCSLSEKSFIIWVDLPDLPEKTDGKVLGIDIGVNKLIADSDGNLYGKEFKGIRDRILRTKRGSKGAKRARATRTNYINRTIKQLPWQAIAVLGVEDLKGIKTGKRRNRGKGFRRAMVPWTVRQVTTRVGQIAQENSVRLVSVNPTNTSRTCPVCGKVSKDNRKGEDFCCIKCNYRNDSDIVGAKNVFARTLATLGSIESPRHSPIAM